MESFFESARNNDVQKLKLLVEDGYSFRGQDFSILERACFSGSLECVEYLISIGVRSSRALKAACAAGQRRVIEYLFEKNLVESEDFVSTLERSDVFCPEDFSTKTLLHLGRSDFFSPEDFSTKNGRRDVEDILAAKPVECVDLDLVKLMYLWLKEPLDCKSFAYAVTASFVSGNKKAGEFLLGKALEVFPPEKLWRKILSRALIRGSSELVETASHRLGLGALGKERNSGGLNWNKLIVPAVEKGWAEIFKFSLPFLDLKTVLPECSSHHLEIVKVLLSLPEAGKYKKIITDFACRGGSVKTIRFLLQAGVTSKSILKRLLPRPFSIRRISKKTADFLMDYFPDSLPDPKMINELICAARREDLFRQKIQKLELSLEEALGLVLETGWVEGLQFLFSSGLSRDLCQAALKRHAPSFEMSLFLSQAGFELKDDSFLEEEFELRIGERDLARVKVLAEKFSGLCDSGRIYYNSILKVGGGNDSEMFEVLRPHFRELLLIGASQNGNLEKIELLLKQNDVFCAVDLGRKNSLSLEQDEKDFRTVFYHAAKNGHLEVLQKFAEHLEAPEVGFLTKEAAVRGHLRVVKFLYDINPPDTIELKISTLRRIIMSDQLETFRYLLGNMNQEDKSSARKRLFSGEALENIGGEITLPWAEYLLELGVDGRKLVRLATLESYFCEEALQHLLSRGFFYPGIAKKQIQKAATPAYLMRVEKPVLEEIDGCYPELFLLLQRELLERKKQTLSRFLRDKYYQPGGPGSLLARDSFLSRRKEVDE